MSEKNLVICDSEIFYAKSLVENIFEKPELAVTPCICTSWEKVLEFTGRKIIDILVVDETNLVHPIEEIEAQQVVVLRRNKNWDEDLSYRTVFKYQCADNLLAEIFETSDVFCNVRTGAQKLIAVYSPIHRVGKTAFAMALGRELAKNENTLYINLEEYPGFDMEEDDKQKYNLGDLLYYIKQECGNVGLRISSTVRRDGKLDYMPSINDARDLKEVSWEEWQEFFKQLLQNSIYTAIILDIGESIQGLFELLQSCDRIYMPILQDETSLNKLRRFEASIKRQEPSVLEKVIRFTAQERPEEMVRQFVKEGV